MKCDQPEPGASAVEDFLAAIDWGRPWLEPWRALGEPIVSAIDWRAALNAAVAEKGICNHQGLPVRFVDHSSLPRGVAYESFISTTGCVPTRDNLHDFFNALVWLAFPLVKRRLNELQAVAIEAAAVQGQAAARGRLRDAVTLFDENAAFFIASSEGHARALRAHAWQEIFLDGRADFYAPRCEVVLFGHALMEKLVNPYKAVTAHALVVTTEVRRFQEPAEERRQWLDAVVAACLGPGLSAADFTPLPVLGVPGWWEGQDAEFYADRSVFRPQRAPRGQGIR